MVTAPDMDANLHFAVNSSLMDDGNGRPGLLMVKIERDSVHRMPLQHVAHREAWLRIHAQGDPRGDGAADLWLERYTYCTLRDCGFANPWLQRYHYCNSHDPVSVEAARSRESARQTGEKGSLVPNHNRLQGLLPRRRPGRRAGVVR